MRAIVTGGGTGGHIYPALAIAKGLKNLDPPGEVLYVGTREGMEAELVPAAGFEFAAVSSVGLTRQLSLKTIKSLASTSAGVIQGIRIISEYKPDLVVGTGGYVCGPVVLAAALKGCPCAIHEQNAYPGITNRLLARVADRVMLTFPDAKRYFPKRARCTVTGLPVRQEILSVSREEGIKYLGLDPDALTLLVVGGSRGARSLNRAMVEVWKEFQGRTDVQIVQISGESGYAETLQLLSEAGIEPRNDGNIILKPYLHRMEYALAASDLVIGRAGASFLAEITARGLPALLIPYPYAAENHQEYNARALVEQGAAVMILDQDLTGTVLVNRIKELLAQPARLKEMGWQSQKMGRPRALEQILRVLSQLTRNI